MKFGELLNVLGWQQGALPADALGRVAARNPDWGRFARLQPDVDPAACDLELPDDLVRAALAEVGLPYRWEGGHLRTTHADPPDPGLAAVEDHLRSAEARKRAVAAPAHTAGAEPERRDIMETQAEEWASGDDPSPDAEQGWAWRPLLLALLGLATGVGVHLIIEGGPRYDTSALQLTALVGLVVTTGLIGFTIERRLWWASLIFALATGGVAAAVTWWNGPPSGWSGADGWRMFSLFLAILIAAPLFQAARDEEALSFPYAAVHDHAWTNVVLWAACWGFVAIVFAMMWLLAALFSLIEIHLVRELLEKQWFWSALSGLAFGAGLGLLREHDAVVRLLQRVVATVLAVLAPALAAGLLLFLLALPFTGLGALWKATDNATPILLGCMIGALILANSVIGNAQEHESRLAALRWGALALALVMLPLAALAALGTGIRIHAYGFTPQRLWAVTFVAIACLYGLAYWWALIRSRLGWPEVARPANLALAFVAMAIALVLATPLVSFNAIATADQVARLESGKVRPEKFDWAALAFRYGAPGRAALKKLQASSNLSIKIMAIQAETPVSPWEAEQARRQAEARDQVMANLRLLPAGTAMPFELREPVGANYSCAGTDKCTLVIGAAEAILLEDACFTGPTDPGKAKTPGETRATMVPGACDRTYRYVLAGGKWVQAESGPPAEAERAAIEAGYKAGKVEVRTVPRRQTFVGGVPVGEPFE